MRLFSKFAAVLFLLAIPAFATDPCPAEATAVTGVTTCYFYANGGNDAAAGTKAAPRAHLPGMPTCTANCTSAAGTGHILKGGDTWTSADMGAYWTWAGTAANRIYIGVDATWYTGGAWSRPIFDCGKTTSACGGPDAAGFYTQIDLRAAYVTIDNIEFKGLYIDDTTTHNVYSIFVLRGNTEVKNCYFHGWGHHATNPQYRIATAISTYMGAGGAAIAGNDYHNNVVDGEDTTQDMAAGFISGGDMVRNNVFRYTVDALTGSYNTITGNLVEYTVTNFLNGALPGGPVHCDSILHYGPAYGNVAIVANNVIRHTAASGCAALWITSLVTTNPALETYAYNNVMYDNALAGGSGITVAGHPFAGSNCDYGTFWIYNNSIDHGSQAGMGNGESSGAYCGGGVRGAVNYANNHLIGSGTTCSAVGVTCTNDGGNLIESTLSANYNDTSTTYPFSPANASAAGIGTGIDVTALSADAGGALLSDTTFAATQAAGNIATAPARSAVARTVTPDAGSYMYSAPAVNYTLSITKSGAGTGTVTNAAPGTINCGATCSQSYAADATADTLTATPAGGSTFIGWSGACVGTGTCAGLVMDSDKSADAEFALSAPTATISCTPSPVLYGTSVTCTTDGTNGTACQIADDSENVTDVACTAATATIFTANWTGSRVYTFTAASPAGPSQAQATVKVGGAKLGANVKTGANSKFQ